MLVAVVEVSHTYTVNQVHSYCFPAQKFMLASFN